MSDVGIAGQKQQISRASELITRIKDLKTLQDKQYSESIANTLANLQKDLDSTVSQAVQQQLNIAMKLDSDGKLDSPQAILKAKQDSMRQIIDTYNNTTLKNVDLAKFYLDTVERSIEQDTQQQSIQAKQKQFDPQMTATMNAGQTTGYMYNAMGQKMTDASGIPLSVKNTSGTFRGNTTLNDGTQALIFENPDGSTRIEKIQDTAMILSKEAVPAMAKLYAQGKINLQEIPASIRDEVLAAA